MRVLRETPQVSEGAVEFRYSKKSKTTPPYTFEHGDLRPRRSDDLSGKMFCPINGTLRDPGSASSLIKQFSFFLGRGFLALFYVAL